RAAKGDRVAKYPAGSNRDLRLIDDVSAPADATCDQGPASRARGYLVEPDREEPRTVRRDHRIRLSNLRSGRGWRHSKENDQRKGCFAHVHGTIRNSEDRGKLCVS